MNHKDVTRALLAGTLRLTLHGLPADDQGTPPDPRGHRGPESHGAHRPGAAAPADDPLRREAQSLGLDWLWDMVTDEMNPGVSGLTARPTLEDLVYAEGVRAHEAARGAAPHKIDDFGAFCVKRRRR